MIGITYFQSYKHRDFLIFRDKVSDKELSYRDYFSYILNFQKLSEIFSNKKKFQMTWQKMNGALFPVRVAQDQLQVLASLRVTNP